jgi:hypothetical protein
MHQQLHCGVQVQATVRNAPMQVDSGSKNGHLQDHERDHCHPDKVHLFSNEKLISARTRSNPAFSSVRKLNPPHKIARDYGEKTFLIKGSSLRRMFL